jgi:LPXTG-site transpeptidase (sortase) family protein
MNRNKKPPIDKEALVQLYREAVAGGEGIEKIKSRVEKLTLRSKVTAKKEKVDEVKREKKLRDSLPKAIRTIAFALPMLFIGIGLFLISSAVMPISDYYLNTLPTLNIFDMKTPIPRESVLDITPAVIAQTSTFDELEKELAEDSFGPVIIDTKLDYTNLANWFDEDEVYDLETGESEDGFILEIPKLDVLSANVKIGGTNLDKNLIQYPGTADPGKPGAPVIFGHSVLRQFYNPYERNPRRYVSIFSKIMTLKNGEDVFIEKNGVKYHYKVSAKTEVKPEDVYILTQNYDAKTIKLVTCVPEGTYLRRGVVTATLVE